MVTGPKTPRLIVRWKDRYGRRGSRDRARLKVSRGAIADGRYAGGCVGHRHPLVDPLPQIAIDFVLQVDGRVNGSIRSAAIRADRDQVFVVAIRGQQLAERLGSI